MKAVVRPRWHWGLAASMAALSLYAVLLVHATGQSLLALTLLAVCALALWTYTSARTNALRYLFPGVAAALVFVVFPMLYTMSMAFTNQSSRNLLDHDRARALLQGESVVQAGTQRGFTLHADGARWRVQVEGGLASPPIALSPEQPTAQTAPLTPVRPELALRQAQDDRGLRQAQPERGAGDAQPLRDIVRLLPALTRLTLTTPNGQALALISLREFAQRQPLYLSQSDGALADRVTGAVYRANNETGFFTNEAGDTLQPGYRVGVGLQHFKQIFSEGKFREPFVSVFAWTVAFAALSVAGAAALGLVLASLLHWEGLRGRGLYRLVLFLPYAVPGFLSILVFKGLFNQNLGEINLILNALFGIKPAWFSDPTLARAMLLIVNIWLGFPYMMVICSGLIQSIPADLYEATAVEGAGPLTNFFRITLPLIAKPLMPLLISAFAFNFNNFVLISLLTNGRPDHADSTLPAGTTDILVSYTWRVAFQDSGQQFGLAAAISTVIFLIVAAITLLQFRLTKTAEKR
jgi:maltose/maltodextrin transport system permease protein